jgi:CheY-like chemotaxis protein
MYTILLVDDVQMFLEIQKEYLQESQVNILTARNGLEALEVIKTKRPDLVFMDVQMPKMDGITCCRTVKSDLAYSMTPIVLLSSSKTKEDIERCYLNQCDFYISKPYGRDSFLDVARRFLCGINRRNKRIACRLNACIYINNDFIPCTIYDLSIGGAYIATDYQTVPGNVVKISFNLPDGEKVECQGRIAWVNGSNTERPPGFGMKFALVPKVATEALIKSIYGVSRTSINGARPEMRYN